MFQKEKFTKFVEKFYLNGKIPSAIIESKDKELKTVAKSIEGDLRCNVEMTDFGLKDCEIGCYNTGKLLGLLKILETQVDIGINSDDDRIMSMSFSDTKGRKATFATTQLDNIEHDGKKSNVKLYDVSIRLNQEVVSDILEASNAIASDSVTFLAKKGKFYVVFNYSQTNDDSIELELEADGFDDDFENISFSLPALKEILNVNGKRFDEGTMEISIKGLLKVYFKDLDSIAEYWLVKLQ